MRSSRGDTGPEVPGNLDIYTSWGVELYLIRFEGIGSMLMLNLTLRNVEVMMQKKKERRGDLCRNPNFGKRHDMKIES